MIWRPDYLTRHCIVAGCNNITDQEHHLAYTRGRYPDEWNRVWVCRDCHRALHRIHDEYARHHGMSLGVFSFHFIADPERTERWAMRTLEPWRPHDVDPAQLSFNDMLGKEGQYFRQWVTDIEKKYGMTLDEFVERRQAGLPDLPMPDDEAA